MERPGRISLGVSDADSPGTSDQSVGQVGEIVAHAMAEQAFTLTIRGVSTHAAWAYAESVGWVWLDTRPWALSPRGIVIDRSMHESIACGTTAVLRRDVLRLGDRQQKLLHARKTASECRRSEPASDKLVSLMRARPVGDDLDQYVALRVEALGAAMRAATVGTMGGSHPTMMSAIRSLVGLGNGLTPSGDDVLCGVLGALSARDAFSERFVESVRAEVANAAPETHPLSAARLLDATRGHFGWSEQRALDAWCNGDDIGLERAARQLTSLGHRSGWDFLSGMALVDAAGRSTKERKAT